MDLDRAVRVIGGSAVAAGLAFLGIMLLLGTPFQAGFLFAVGVIVGAASFSFIALALT